MSRWSERKPKKTNADTAVPSLPRENRVFPSVPSFVAEWRSLVRGMMTI